MQAPHQQARKGAPSCAGAGAAQPRATRAAALWGMPELIWDQKVARVRATVIRSIRGAHGCCGVPPPLGGATATEVFLGCTVEQAQVARRLRSAGGWGQRSTTSGHARHGT